MRSINKYYLSFILLLMVGFMFSQAPVNDNCTGAINIPLATPPACGTGTQTGATAVVTGNITNATPGNPYIYQTGCTGSSATMSFPANDVWYSFVATGYQTNINITSAFANPNVALYSGNCAALGGGIGGCAVGTGGSVSLTVNQCVPGTTYYLQISGATGQVGTFTMNINNSVSCANCLVNSNITVTPPPVGGAYPPNTTVQFCFHIGQFNTINTNWLHGVQLSFGSCWNAASLVTNIPTPAGTSGSWAYYPAGIGIQNAQNWGPGWYFDYNPTDGNPKNNFGDLPTTTVTASMWNFCATITTKNVCNPGCDLSVTFNTSGDGESGSWSNSGCANDPPAIFHAVGACCPPIMSSIPAKCFGTPTGTAIATPVGAVGPYTYIWTGPAAYTSSATLVPGASTITNVPAGIYTVQVIDKNLCAVNATVQVTQPPAITLTPTFTNASCLTNGSASVTATGGTPGYTYTWSPIGGNASTASNLTPGIYTVTVNDSKLCAQTATVSIVLTGSVSPAFTTPTYTQCLTGNSFVFTASVAAGTHTFAFNPLAGSPATGLVSPYGPVSFTAPGTYSVIHTIVTGSCTATTTSVIVIKPQPTVTANNSGPLCVGSNLTLSSTGGGTYSWAGPNAFVSAVQNPTIVAATAAAAGVYTVTVTLNGCTNTNTTLVTLTTATASATNTGPYCAGSTIQLNTPAATSYTWSGPAAFASNLQNPVRPASTVAMSGTYTVIITAGTCTATATTLVTVNALPTPIAANTGPYCPGVTIQLNGSAASSYTWSGPAFASNLQSPTIAGATTAMSGVYTFSVTDVKGCINGITTTVLVNPNPTPLIGSNSPVCLNTNINLNSGGGATYSWSGPAAYTSAVQNPTIVAATVANAGIYTVTVTSAAACTATATVNVSVLTPSTTATNTGPYCAGTTIQLNTPVATSYTWSGPGAFASNLQNPVRPAATVAMSGTYTVMISIGSCTASATTSVTVNPLPVPVANNNSPVCIGNPITFTGAGGVSYFWGGPLAYTVAAQNPTIAAATAAMAGTYTLLVVDANTCTNVAITNVVINPTPTITVNNPTVCVNQTISFTATGGATYAWSGPGGFVSALQNPTIPSATAANSGQYTVTVTSAAGCTNTAVSTATVFPLPTPAITSNTPCVGSTLSLSGSGGAVYAWSGPNSFSSLSQNPNITTVSMLANGTYTLLASAGTCTAMTTAVVTINALPNPTMASNSPVCVGTPINFTGNGGVSYSWSGPAGFTDATQNPTIAVSTMANNGTYTLTVTDANGCVNSTTKPVVVNAQPVVSANGGTACENSNTNLTASGGVSYLWSGPGGFTSASQNPVVLATAAAVGQYTVLVTSASGCTNTAMATIGINPIPTPNIVTNSPICINNVLSIAAGGGVSYSWTGPNGFFSTAQSATIQANSVNVGGVYYVTATGANGCVATTSMNTVINPIPPLNITSGPNRGCAPLCVSFTAATTPSATVDWIMGDGSYTGANINSNACYQTTGIFTITASVIDVNGCQNSATYTVQVYPHPVADFNYDPYKPIVNQNADVHFTDASYGANITGWSWFFMNNASATSSLQNPTYVYEDAGEFVIALVVTSDQGCTDTILKSILVGQDFGIFVPNAFTVNGDGLNDRFYAKGYGITKFEMNIFDRWGEKVFSSHDIQEAWDGTYQNRGTKIVKDDTYTWIINVTNVFGKAKEFTGHVTLIK